MRCIFEYLYRDAGNWKTYGQVSLVGDFDPDHHVAAIVESLESETYFVAEQVGITALQAEHLNTYGASTGEDLDHAFHEFVSLRPARSDDIWVEPVGGLTNLIAQFKQAAGKWDCTQSPFGRW